MKKFKPGKYIIYYDDGGISNASKSSFKVEVNTLEELQSHYYDKGIFLYAERIGD